MAQKVVLVFGATGLQGGSVVDHLLTDGSFAVRAATRDPTKATSVALADRGVEVIKCDQHNDQDIQEAFRGVYATFVVTDAMDPATAQREAEIGSAIAKAAKEAGVEHYVWSTLPNVEKRSGGKWDVPHFTNKAKVNDAVADLGFKYHTFVEVGGYFQNFSNFGYVKETDGGYTIRMPLGLEDRWPGIDIKADTGKVVLAVLKDPEGTNGNTFAVAGFDRPMSDYLASFEKVTGRPLKLKTVPHEEILGQHKAVAHMFGYMREFGYWRLHGDEDSGARLIGKTGGKLSTFEDYLNRVGGWPPKSQ